MSKSLATYHVDGGFRKIYPCRPGTDPGTVDLLGPEGELLVGGCPVIDDPETYEGRLPAGYATVEGPAKAAKKSGAKKAPAKKAAAEKTEDEPEGDGDGDAPVEGVAAATDPGSEDQI